MRMKTACSLLLLYFCLIVLSGCKKENRPEGMPPLHSCRITVTQDGKPLEGANVGLYAQDAKWRSSGTTDVNGVADLVTQGQFKGAPEGSYKVTVSKEEIVSLATPEQLAAIEKAKAENPKWYDAPNIKQETWQLVEKQYTDKESTTLELIVSKGRNSETFDVGKAVRVKQTATE